MKHLAFVLAFTALGCTHIVTDPLDVPVGDGPGDVNDLADPGNDPGVERQPELCAEACADPGHDPGPDAPPAEELTPACQAACEGGTCPAGQCCEEGLCHAEDAQPPSCGWFVPGQEGLDEMCRVPAGLHVAGCAPPTADCVYGDCDPGTATCDAWAKVADTCCPSSAEPQVDLRLTRAVWLDRFEVTGSRYLAYLKAPANADAVAPGCHWNVTDETLATGEGWRDKLPVTCVNALEAERYCAWKAKRLPHEAEWEAGARSTADDQFPWGREFDTHRAQCYRNPVAGAYDSKTECSDTYADGPCGGADLCADAAPVYETTLEADFACKLPDGASKLGLCHLAGNAAEWTADGWSPDHEIWACGGEVECLDPHVAPTTGGQRVVRGGSWDSTPVEIMAWAREGKQEDTRSERIGFRCAWVAP